MRVLVLHGWQGSPAGHWQAWLADELRAGGASVRFPDLPACDEPCPDRWGLALHGHLDALARDDAGGERIVCCHSLACVLWLREADRVAQAHRVDRVVLVAPPCPGADVEQLQSFYPTGCQQAALAHAADVTRLVCSDDDPYCAMSGGACRVWGEPLGLPTDRLAAAGHLNRDSGYGPWPAMAAWVRGERDDIVARDGAGADYVGAKNGAET